MIEVYSPEEVQAVLDIVNQNPNSFIKLSKKYCKNVSVKEVARSLEAWGMKIDKNLDDSSDNWTSGRRKNHNDTTVSTD